MAEHDIIEAQINQSVPLGDSGELSSQITLKGPADQLMIIMDKYAREYTYEGDQTSQRVNLREYPYEKAALLVQSLRTGGKPLQVVDVSDPGDGEGEASATGLNGTIESLVDEAKEALRKTKVSATSGTDPDGKRNLKVRVEYDGEEVLNFTGEDLAGLDLGDVAQATGLDDPEGLASLVRAAEATGLEGADDVAEEDGAEVVAANDVTRRWHGMLTRFRATSNGENDRIDSENTNVLTQTKAGFVVISALDANVNAGINATLAIFIA